MPVPRRRQSRGMAGLTKLPSQALKVLDVDFVFQNTRVLLLWGFAPAVVLVGLMTEPRPSPIDLFNIFE
jgi:hypothetical protein